MIIYKDMQSLVTDIDAYIDIINYNLSFFKGDKWYNTSLGLNLSSFTKEQLELNFLQILSSFNFCEVLSFVSDYDDESNTLGCRIKLKIKDEIVNISKSIHLSK